VPIVLAIGVLVLLIDRSNTVVRSDRSALFFQYSFADASIVARRRLSLLSSALVVLPFFNDEKDLGLSFERRSSGSF
jgi:hypothetical protein